MAQPPPAPARPRTGKWSGVTKSVPRILREPIPSSRRRFTRLNPPSLPLPLVSSSPWAFQTPDTTEMQLAELQERGSANAFVTQVYFERIDLSCRMLALAVH